MDQAFKIETLDRSGRWYLTAGSKSIYDLRVRNDSNNPADCSLVLEDPPAGATVNPQSFILRGHEVRTVTVVFAADMAPSRSQRAFLTLRDNSGAILASFEHPLVSTGGSDCSIELVWKEIIVESGEPRGFLLSCSLRSKSEGSSSFPVSLAPHPSLTFPEIAPLSLEPGALGEVAIPVLWDRSVKDDKGQNHPLLLEASVPVSNGRRTCRLRWDSFESKLSPFAWNGVLAAEQSPAAQNGAPAPAAKPSAPAASPLVPSVAPLMLNGYSAPTQVAASQDAATAQTNVAQPQSDNNDLPLLAAMAATSSATPQSAPGQVVVPQQAPAVGEPTAAKPALVGAPLPAAIVQPASTSTAAAPAAVVSEAQAAPATVDGSLSTPAPAKMVLTRQHPEPARSGRPIPPGFWIGGLALAALVVAGVLFKPTAPIPGPSVNPVVVAAPVVTANASAAPATAAVVRTQLFHKPAALRREVGKSKTVALVPTPHPAPTAQATPKPATPKPATPPSTSVKVSAPAVHHSAPAAPAPPAHNFNRKPHLYSPVAGPVVALGGIQAFYGPRGHAVRVLWTSDAQSSASVQLIDDHGVTLNSATVRGGRQSVLLYLPKRYRGSVTVQVSSTGRLGERVAETAYLPPFSN